MSGLTLSRAEQRVADLVAEGLTNPQIAARLYLSPRTVQSHVSNACGKLGVHSRVLLAVHVATQERQAALAGKAVAA